MGKNKENISGRYRHRHRSGFEQWLSRVRSSRREKRKLTQLVVVIAAVLIAFAVGYYYFGPSFSSMGE